METYDFYTGEYIKRFMLTKDEYNDYVFDDSIKNMKLDNNVLYGVHVTLIRKTGIFSPDKYNIDFIEEVPEDICNKIEQGKKLKQEIEEFKEKQRFKQISTSVIKDNRIVSDKTFAVRFLSYLMDNYRGGAFGHPMDEEEYEYMIHVAIRLLKHQVETCPEEEKSYFINLDKDYKDYKDIVKYVCKYNDEFYQYLIKSKFIK